MICLEKLAMALAFIETPAETPVVLTKNLRICSDCHETANRLSRLRKREIVIREHHNNPYQTESTYTISFDRRRFISVPHFQ